jgi:phosphoribosyl-ATP pyrophosphohydrolase/phosphoribosyl-AMP cyclohydrolase
MLEVKFSADGLIPAVAQDARTGEVLMVAYMNREALERTLRSGRAWYWSRSRGALWQKGADSGHTQRVQEVRVDCDADTVLLVVDQAGPACHTGHRTCFYRDSQGRELPDGKVAADGEIFEALFGRLKSRRAEMPSGSYTAALLREGRAKIGAKVMEEAEELTRAAREESAQRVVEEAADLIYHSWVLLVERGIELSALRKELERRRNGG